MVNQSKSDNLIESLNKLVDTAYGLVVETIQKEGALYNREFMEKLYPKNERAAQIETVKKTLFQQAIGNNIDACIYILEHQDWFLEDLTQLPKEKK